MSTSSLAIRFSPEPVRSLAAASILGTYVAVGSALANSSRQFFIQNLTNATVMFSFDGVNDHFPLPSSGFFLDDVTSNGSVTQGWFLPQGTILYVKQVGTPSTGSVYFSVFYAAF